MVGSSRVSRSARALPVGSLRPAIVLYDEPHPLGEEIGSLQAYDLGRSPDILLVMGTSLKVHGLKKVVKAFAKAVHAREGIVVFVNATPPSKEWEGVIDYHIHGTTDAWVERVEADWRHVRPQDWETQTTLQGEVVKDPTAVLTAKKSQAVKTPTAKTGNAKAVKGVKAVKAASTSRAGSQIVKAPATSRATGRPVGRPKGSSESCRRLRFAPY